MGKPTVEVEWTDTEAFNVADCGYCPKTNVNVRTEPFGRQDACKACWEQICYGERED